MYNADMAHPESLLEVVGSRSFVEINPLPSIEREWICTINRITRGVRTGAFGIYHPRDNPDGFIHDAGTHRGVQFVPFGIDQTGMAALYFKMIPLHDQALQSALLYKAIVFGETPRGTKRGAISILDDLSNKRYWFFYELAFDPILRLQVLGNDDAWYQSTLSTGKHYDGVIRFGQDIIPQITGYNYRLLLLQQKRFPFPSELLDAVHPVL